MNTSDNSREYLIKQNDNSCTYSNKNSKCKNQNSVYISINHIQKGYSRNFSSNSNDKFPISKEFKCLFVTTPEKLLLLLLLVILSLSKKAISQEHPSLYLPQQFVRKP